MKLWKVQCVSEGEILHNLTPTKQDAFLAAYAKCGNIARAAEIAICARQTHYDWMNNDPSYPERFKDARELFRSHVFEAVRSRAIDGWEEPVFYEGMEVGKKRKYSDTLLKDLAQAVMPQVFAEKKEVRHTGKVEHEHKIQMYLPENPRHKVIEVDRNGNGKHHIDPPASGSAGTVPGDDG